MRMDAAQVEEVLAGVEVEARPVSPEVVLWSAVVERCFIDAFEASDNILANGKASRLHPDSGFDPEFVRAEARRWLVSDLDPWRTWREECCDMAGLDPDKIRAMASRRLREGRAEEAAAEHEGRAPRRSSGHRRQQGRFDVTYIERAEDMARLEELKYLDAEHRAAEVLADAKAKAARLRARQEARKMATLFDELAVHAYEVEKTAA